MHSLTGLNDEQQKAMEAENGPVMVVAGPGTGKTRTLTARIAYLLETGQAKPAEILALTFTKKAAEEMQNRVATTPSDKPHITTFHALCYELLGSDTPFATDTQRFAIIKKLSKPKEYKGLSTRELGLAISRAKNSPEMDELSIAKLMRGYNNVLAGQGMRDFDDLLLDTYTRLKADKAFRQAVQKRYKYILVDEFQDTNHLQYEILRLLLSHDNIFVIGDPKQSIYGFRGASGTIFTQLERDFPNAQKIALHVNYRSAPEIVRLSGAIFPDQSPLTPAKKRNGQVCAVQVLNEYSEAAWVLNEIQRAIGGGDFLRAVSDDERSAHRNLRDFAVLYRSRSAAVALQKAVGESGLPYQVVGDGSPYEKPQVQVIIGFMRAAVTGDEPRMEGIPANQARQALELTNMDKLAAPSLFAERVTSVLGFEPSRELSQFISTLVRFNTLEPAVQYFDDIAGNDFYDPQADTITLLTIHAAKGLEFSHVFLIGMQEGILPGSRADPEEERRLFYVAATRARHQLALLYAKSRGGKPVEPSRFIIELAGDMLPQTVDENLAADQRRAARRKLKRSQQRLF